MCTVWRPTASDCFFSVLVTFFFVSLREYNSRKKKNSNEKRLKMTKQNTVYRASHYNNNKKTHWIYLFGWIHLKDCRSRSIMHKKKTEIKCHDWNFINRLETHFWLNEWNSWDRIVIDRTSCHDIKHCVWCGIDNTSVCCVYSIQILAIISFPFHSEGNWLVIDERHLSLLPSTFWPSTKHFLSFDVWGMFAYVTNDTPKCEPDS